MTRPDTFELTVPVNASDHMVGPTHAAVTLLEYGDFECPNCKQAAPAAKLLLRHFASRIRFVYRHFPLEEVHPHALDAAETAEAAAGQGKFWLMHDVVFENQPHLKLPQLRSYAEQLQLDIARYTAEIADHIYLQRIREHMQSGRESGVRATPAFFVQGRICDVSFGMRSLYDAVEAVLQAER